MAEHVGVGGIGQRTIALPCLDAAPQLVGLGRAPHRPKIVAMLAQVAHRLGPDTTRPHIPIGRNLRRCHPRQARDHLALLHQRALDQVVVAIAERLRDARHPTELGIANALLQPFDHRLVLADGRRDAHAHRVQFHALLGDFADERVGLQFIAHEGIDVLELVDIEGGDHGVHPQGEVLVAPLERFEPGIGAHGPLEIAFDPAHHVVFLAHPIQGQVDDHLAAGSGLQDALDACGDDLVLDAVGGDVDDAGAAVPVGRLHHLGQVLAQRGFAAAKGEPVGVAPDGGKRLLIFLQREVVIGALPHVAGFAARVAAITDTDGQVHRQRQRLAQRVGRLQLRDLW